MKKNRLIYLAVLGGTAVLYFFLPGRISSLLLSLTLLLPLLSLLLSIPAFCTIRLTLEHPAAVPMGEEAQVRCSVTGALPQVRIRGRVQGEDLLTGQRWEARFPATLSTEHCGGVRIRVHRLRMCDYLGLLPIYIKHDFSGVTVVRPHPVPLAKIPELPRRAASSWRPKPGGGFGENHDLRPYRPGDHLRQIHWKMTAKTGKYIYRETLIPDQTQAMIRLDLTGTPEELDRKLGRMRWLGEKLLEQNIAFAIRAHTGDGVKKWVVRDEPGLLEALDSLLCCRCAPSGTIMDTGGEAQWCIYIGGEPDEV